LSLRSPLRPRNRGKKAVPTGTPAPTLLGSRPSPPPQGESLPFRGRGNPHSWEASRVPSCPCACPFSLEGEARRPPRRESHPFAQTMPGGPEGEAPSPPSARRPSAPPARGPHHGPPPQGHGGHHRLPAPSRSGPGLRLKGPRHAPALSALALPGGKMTAPRLRDGPKERRGKPPLYLPASAGMGWAVRGKRSTTPSLRGESLPRPTSRGGAEDPRLAPVPFAQSYPFVCSLIAPPRPSRARPCSECGSCPCPRRSIWGWDPKEAQHLGEEASRMPPPLKEQVPHFCEKSEVSRT
jgi:hypothetical protein